MTDKERIYYLIQQKRNGRLSPEERADLNILMKEGEAVRAVLYEMMEKIEAEGQAAGKERQVDASRWDNDITEILAMDKMEKVQDAGNTNSRRISMQRRWWMAAAAVLVIGLMTGLLVRRHLQRAPVAVNGHEVNRDVAPGGNKAILTLSNGQQVVLDSAQNGVLSQEGRTRVVKLADGQLAYEENAGTGGAGRTKADKTVLYNTMSTPKGGQYKLILPDGSAVWLNSESSITYPASFTGEVRGVSITGEAYFEIAKDKTRPFHVKMKDVEIGVLGTHFNVNGYEDEDGIKTTLLEGSVKVEKGGSATILKPGQQAWARETVSVTDKVDIDQVIAWKDGYFSFEKADIRTVMRQLARWYNVEVLYPASIPKGGFSGEIGRGLTLAQVLKILEKERVQFKIEEGRRIVILP